VAVDQVAISCNVRRVCGTKLTPPSPTPCCKPKARSWRSLSGQARSRAGHREVHTFVIGEHTAQPPRCKLQGLLELVDPVDDHLDSPSSSKDAGLPSITSAESFCL